MDFDQLVWVQPPIGEGWDDVTPEPVIWTAVDLLDQAWRSNCPGAPPGWAGSANAGSVLRSFACVVSFGATRPTEAGL